MKQFILYFLFIIPLMTVAQNKEIEPIDVTQKVSVEDFLQLRKFVFDQKEYTLHGSLYSECPFSEIKNVI